MGSNTCDVCFPIKLNFSWLDQNLYINVLNLFEDATEITIVTIPGNLYHRDIVQKQFLCVMVAGLIEMIAPCCVAALSTSCPPFCIIEVLKDS